MNDPPRIVVSQTHPTLAAPGALGCGWAWVGEPAGCQLCRLHEGAGKRSGHLGGRREARSARARPRSGNTGARGRLAKQRWGNRSRRLFHQIRLLTARRHSSMSLPFSSWLCAVTGARLHASTCDPASVSFGVLRICVASHVRECLARDSALMSSRASGHMCPPSFARCASSPIIDMLFAWRIVRRTREVALQP